MDPPQTPPLPNFSQKPKFDIFFCLKPSLIAISFYQYFDLINNYFWNTCLFIYDGGKFILAQQTAKCQNYKKL